MSCSPSSTPAIASTSDAFISSAHTIIKPQCCSNQELRLDNSASTKHHVASLFSDSSCSKNILLNSNNHTKTDADTKNNAHNNIRYPDNDATSNNNAQSSSNVPSRCSPRRSPASSPFPECNKLSANNPNPVSCEQIITKQHQQPQAGDIIHHHPVFVKDTSKYWYKPTISREEAINMLRDKPPGTFVVRDSNSFPGAFGLALKVATPPPGIHSGDGTELVRHFLIEPSPKGVKLKGCNNEPIFGTLSALVYQHSITALALPTKLLLPDYDPASTPEHISAAQALLQQGAACNVTYIASLDTESLTGPEAVRRCIGDALELYNKKLVQPVSVHFKVSSQGVTVTDNTRRLFFRRHYPVQSVTFAGIDPADRRWDNSCIINEGLTSYVKSARMFAFVARKIGSRTDNACHVFAELEPEQPASAVVNFITKVMMGRK